MTLEKAPGAGESPWIWLRTVSEALSPVDLRLALLDFAGVTGAGGGLWLERQSAGFERLEGADREPGGDRGKAARKIAGRVGRSEWG